MAGKNASESWPVPAVCIKTQDRGKKYFPPVKQMSGSVFLMSSL